MSLAHIVGDPGKDRALQHFNEQTPCWMIFYNQPVSYLSSLI